MNLPLTNEEVFIPDDSIFASNYALFAKRFPLLAAQLGIENSEKAKKLFSQRPSHYMLIHAKASKPVSVQPTLVVNKKYVHSKYKPEEEARRLLDSDFFTTDSAKKSCIFAGLGLGYLPTFYAKQHPQAQIIIIEPDIIIFLCFLAAQKNHQLLLHDKLTLLIGIPAHEASAVLCDSQSADTSMFRHTAAIEVNSDWFNTFFSLYERVKSKHTVNAKTLERFAVLWLNNTRKNIDSLCRYPKIDCFNQAFKNVPAVILAGGPSLVRHIAVLKRYKQNYLTIAVDTAVRACVRMAFVPDFILSFDPQYWNYLHTAGLATEHSILISDASVFPAVLRQQYKAVFLSYSSVPFVQYLDATADKRAKLAAGGSVATTAWDFARYMGASPIIMAGLDLSFPHNQTHFTGSTFEEKAHIQSSRTMPAEMMNCQSLFSAFPLKHEDYYGSLVLTDKRMLLYAWWFESMMLIYPDSKTYNFMPEGIKITGMPLCIEKDFLIYSRNAMARVRIEQKLNKLIAGAYSKEFLQSYNARLHTVRTAVMNLLPEIKELEQLAMKAEALCTRLNTCLSSHIRDNIITELECLEVAMRQNTVKDIVSILFFDARTLETVKKETTGGEQVHDQGKQIYQRIITMARSIYAALEKC